MRNLLLAAVLLASIVATPVLAEPHTDSPSQLQEYAGAYTLSNGRVLTISRTRRHLVAQLDGDGAVILRPTGPAAFTTESGDLHVLFDQRRNGNVAGVTVSGRAVAPAEPKQR